jgi:hypothetical protein
MGRRVGLSTNGAEELRVEGPDTAAADEAGKERVLR